MLGRYSFPPGLQRTHSTDLFEELFEQGLGRSIFSPKVPSLWILCLEERVSHEMVMVVERFILWEELFLKGKYR